MFSLLFGGLGDLVAPRPRFEEEIASLLRGGNYDRALLLLKQSHNTTLLNNLDKSGLAPIHIASACGAIEFLLELISIGAEVSLPASSGNTALHFAAINNRKAVVEVLIRSGADPSTPNGEGVIAGELCTDVEIRALLLRDPSQLPTMIGGLSPFALTRQHMRALVEAQDRSPHRMSSPNHTTTITDSPAATNGTVDRFVIHSQMMSPDHSGMMLNGHGVDDDDGMQRGIVQEDDDEELRELQEAVLAAATETTVAMSTLESYNLRFQMFKFCQVCHEEKMRKLLKYDPSLATCRASHMLTVGLDGFTPLHIAAQFNNIKALKILLEVDGVSAWIRDLQGRTPLHIAAGRGHDEACTFLRHRMATEGQGKQDPVGEHAPIDLAGSTPAGYASIITKGSVSPKVRATLFQPGDKTVLPRTPHTGRAGKSPKRSPYPLHPSTSSSSGLPLSTNTTINDEIIFAFSVAQGWKAEMEDKVVVSFPVAKRPAWSLFGVCDGHGGSFCSSYLAANFPRIVADVAAEQVIPGTFLDMNDEITTIEMLHQVLTMACLRADDDLRHHPRLQLTIKDTEIIDTGSIECDDSSGSTGVLCLLTKHFIAVGNVGDSRALLARRNMTSSSTGTTTAEHHFSPPLGITSTVIPATGILNAIPMSTDHKFSIVNERQRAEAAGATVSEVIPKAITTESTSTTTSTSIPTPIPTYEVYTNRYKSGTSRLRMSRSFGDFFLKQTSTLSVEQQAVIAVPEIMTHCRSSGDAFIVLACDGVFDVMNNQQVIDLLGHHLGYTAYGDIPVNGITTQRCAEACDALLQECLTLGAHDNLSVLVVVCGGMMDMSTTIMGQSSLSPTCTLLQSPPLALNKSTVLATPSSGAATRTPVDRTLSRVLYSPTDQSPTGLLHRHLCNTFFQPYSTRAHDWPESPVDSINHHHGSTNSNNISRHLEFTDKSPKQM